MCRFILNRNRCLHSTSIFFIAISLDAARQSRNMAIDCSPHAIRCIIQNYIEGAIICGEFCCF